MCIESVNDNGPNLLQLLSALQPSSSRVTSSFVSDTTPYFPEKLSRGHPSPAFRHEAIGVKFPQLFSVYVQRALGLHLCSFYRP